MKKYNYFRQDEFLRLLSFTELEDFHTNPALEKNLGEIIARLNLIRQAFGHPILITSWYRDANHNYNAKGSPTSQHLDGTAVDIDSTNNELLFATIKKMIADGMDFGQIITYGDAPIRFIHLSLPTRDSLNEFIKKK